MYRTVRIALLFVKNRFRSNLSLRKCLVSVLVVLVLFGFVYINSYRDHAGVVINGGAIMDKYMTSFAEKRVEHFNPNLPSNLTLPVEAEVLLVYHRRSTLTAKGIRVFLESQRVKLTIFLHSVNKTINLISTSQGNTTVGRYSLVIFAGFETLFEKWSVREKLPYFNYCKFFNVPMFLVPRNDKDRYKSNSSNNTPLPNITALQGNVISSNSIVAAKVTASKLLYYSKPGLKLRSVSDESWVVFHPISLPRDFSSSNRSEDQILDKTMNISASLSEEYDIYLSVTYQSEQELIIAPSILADRGATDGIRKVIIGSPLNLWLTEILLLDLVREYSRESVLRFGRKRWIMVDIDDIFVAPEGRKMNAADVEVKYGYIECLMYLHVHTHVN